MPMDRDGATERVHQIAARAKIIAFAQSPKAYTSRGPRSPIHCATWKRRTMPLRSLSCSS
jgi:hypothetical protein